MAGAALHPQYAHVRGNACEVMQSYQSVKPRLDMLSHGDPLTALTEDEAGLFWSNRHFLVVRWSFPFV